MKRITQVTSSLARGGAETLLYQFVVHTQTELDHIVCYFHDGPIRKQLEEAGIQTVQIKGLFCLYDPIFWVNLYRALKKLQPDCIHSWLWSANFTTRIIGKILGIPVINSLHNKVDHDGFIRRLLDRFSYFLSDSLVAVSDVVKNSWKNHQGFIPAKITVISNGIIATKSDQPKSRASLLLADEEFVIGAVGRLVPVKCFDLLLKAVALLEFKAKLIIIGDGPEERKLKQLALDLGIENKMIFIHNQLAMPYYPLFDCFCLPCPSEGFGLVILEAMVHKVPVVAVDQGGIHPVIDHLKTGLLLRSLHVEEIVQALGNLYGDRTLANELAQSAYQRCLTTFSLEAMCQGYVNLYHSLKAAQNS